MSLNESIVKDADLEWFKDLGCADGCGLHFAPTEPAAERESFSEEDLGGALEQGAQ